MWGYCSSDCYLDNNKEIRGILRIVDRVTSLPDHICQKFLNDSLPENVIVWPKILCVGLIKKWGTEVWQKMASGYEKVPPKKAQTIIADNHYGEYLGIGGYIASAGTCSGDSGGPMFQKEEDRYIVTGRCKQAQCLA